MPELNLTRGGLTPATITNSITNEVVKFMFNPYQYTLSKSNTWSDKPVIGLNLPLVTFQQGGAITLSLTLHFDSLLTGGDVRVYTVPLWKMTMIDDSRKNASSGKSEPPPVVFDWGKLHFKAIITSLSEKFTLFTDQGIPLRSEVDIQLRQYLDEADLPPQLEGPTSSAPGTTSTTLIEGDRLDNIAAGAGISMRQLAADNNIDNPLNIPAGTTLRVNRG
jgi:hypothetical protein